MNPAIILSSSEFSDSLESSNAPSFPALLYSSINLSFALLQRLARDWLCKTNLENCFNNFASFLLAILLTTFIWLRALTAIVICSVLDIGLGRRLIGLSCFFNKLVSFLSVIRIWPLLGVIEWNCPFFGVIVGNYRDELSADYKFQL